MNDDPNPKEPEIRKNGQGKEERMRLERLVTVAKGNYTPGQAA